VQKHWRWSVLVARGVVTSAEAIARRSQFSAVNALAAL
jgi:hypothetical protein